MPIRRKSIWDNVPGADQIRQKIVVAKDDTLPLQERQAALSYLNGQLKVLVSLENRQPLRDYLAAQVAAIRADLYY